MKKSKTRLYISKLISANILIYIKNKQFHFLKNVIRIKIDDEINVFDGISGEWQANVISINRDNLVLRVNKNIKKYIKTSDIWLIFAPLKQQRINIVIQKATELGVSRIIPCITEFTNTRNINRKNLYDNAVEAAEQSGRLDIPEVEKIVNLNELLSQWPNERTILHCNENKELTEKKLIIDKIKEYKNFNTKWAVLVGPEGGFSNLEIDLFTKNKNIIPVSLGDKVLRSDTAITVALYCVQEILG